MRGGLARDLAAIDVLPGRTGEVMTDDRALAIMQISFGPLERPLRLTVGIHTAGVDLPSIRMGPQDDLLARRRLNAGGNVGISLAGGLRLGQADESQRKAARCSVCSFTGRVYHR